ncbi:MAG TPA: hypothetical protein PK198_09015, partial [Saprospiraceae bacterium]|nr:hypothetical protein [Saprospiraceae bacterium]
VSKLAAEQVLSVTLVPSPVKVYHTPAVVCTTPHGAKEPGSAVALMLELEMVIPQLIGVALAHKSLAGAQEPGMVVTAVDSALTVLASLSQAQRVLMLCAGPVWL